MKNNAVQTHTIAPEKLINSATTFTLKTARCSAKSNLAATVSEFKTNLTNVNAPMRVNESRVSLLGVNLIHL